MRNVIFVKKVLLALALIGVWLFGWANVMVSTVCDFELLSSTPSADGRYAADVTFAKCGRDFGRFYLVSLRPSIVAERASAEPSGTVVASALDDYDLWPVWHERELEIRTEGAPTIIKSSWNEIKIVARARPMTSS